MSRSDNNISTIQKVNALLAQAADSTTTLQQIARMLAESTNSLQCIICVFDPQEGKLAIRAAHGIFLDEIRHFQAENSMSGKAYFNSKTINCVITEALRNSQPHMSILKRINSVLSVPLITAGRTIGVIILNRGSKQVYPQREVTLLETVAVPIAGFILFSHMAKHTVLTSQRREELTSDGLNSAGSDVALHGKSIVDGVVLGRAMLLSGVNALEDEQVFERAENLSVEKEMLEQAVAAAAEALERVSHQISEVLTEADAGIFEVHAMLLHDPTLLNRIKQYIDQGYKLKTALHLTLKEFAAEYEKVEDEYIRARLADVKDVLLRINTAIDNLSISQKHEHDSADVQSRIPERKVILVAKELLPSQLVASPLKQVCGILCESGEANSHAAILARALHIPMLGAVPGIFSKVRAGDSLLLDGRAGFCFVQPSRDLIKQYQNVLKADHHGVSNRHGGENLPELDDSPQTSDGQVVHLSGNIMLFSEIPSLRANGIQDVGLYRTEFMFMIRKSMPDEDEQYRVLSRLVNAIDGARATMRVLDIGGDKPLSYIDWGHEDNPSLGCRGLRFLLSRPDIFKVHIRALLRASALNRKARIMIPMVADDYDLKQTKDLIQEAKRSLRKDGLAFNPNVEIGIMLEVPSAVLALDKLLPEISFVSIGTNGMTQYLFAVDRGNPRVGPWYRQYHPLLFRLLRHICKTVAEYPGKELSICGELGGNTLALPALLGCGLRNFSMNASAVPPLRQLVRKLDTAECEKLADTICQCDSDSEVRTLLEDFSKGKIRELYT